MSKILFIKSLDNKLIMNIILIHACTYINDIPGIYCKDLKHFHMRYSLSNCLTVAIMNRSISSLFCIQNKLAPLFILSSAMTNSNIFMKNSRFISSFSSIIYHSGSSTSGMISIQHSTFNRFLNHVVQTEQQYELSNQVITDKIQSTDEHIDIHHCDFLNCKSESHGSAIDITSPSAEVKVSNCYFYNCRCNNKGGALYAVMNTMTLSSNCFILCRCGKENGNDGSTIYAMSKIGINTSFVNAHRCPDIGEMCWYGIFILGQGKLRSENINMSNSEVEYISGLAHFRPDKDGSFLKFYSSTGQRTGNALSFIDMTFVGDHMYGALINDTSKSGILYVQNSTTTVTEFYFLRNSGKITYSCVGGVCNFVKCVFESDINKNHGNGFGTEVDCQYSKIDATPMPMILAEGCEANKLPGAPVGFNSQKKLSIYNVGGRIQYGDIVKYVSLIGFAVLIITYVYSNKHLYIRKPKLLL